MNTLPLDDPLRVVLHNEVHARPSARIHLPGLIVLVGVFNEGVTREQEWEHLKQLKSDLSLDEMQGNFVRMRLGSYTLKWERHTEFTRYSLVPVGKFEGTDGLNRVESSSAVRYEYMVCVRRGDSSYDILTKIPADGEFEAQVIEHLAKGFKRNPASNVKGMEGLRMAAKKVYAEQRGMADEDFKLTSSTANAEEQKN